MARRKRPLVPTPWSPEFWFKFPGVYRDLLKSECEGRTYPDPRLYLTCNGPEWAQLVAESRREAEVLFSQRLADGVPLVSSGWRIAAAAVVTGKDEVALRDQYGDVKFMVFHDDTIEPAQ